LISNAIKFSDNHSTVQLKLTEFPTNETNIIGINFHVIDEGIGLTEQEE
jgi:signal transduction histidine kinase